MIHRWMAVACLLGGLAVVLGAFGAHGLKSQFEQTMTDQQEIDRRLDVWETGVRYHMFHALALLLVGVAARTQEGASGRFSRRLTWAAGCFVGGIFIFSGCLYALTLTDIKILGAVVPIGGLSMIAGWLLLVVEFWGGRLGAGPGA